MSTFLRRVWSETISTSSRLANAQRPSARRLLVTAQQDVAPDLTSPAPEVAPTSNQVPTSDARKKASGGSATAETQHRGPEQFAKLNANTLPPLRDDWVKQLQPKDQPQPPENTPSRVILPGIPQDMNHKAVAALFNKKEYKDLAVKVRHYGFITRQDDLARKDAVIDFPERILARRLFRRLRARPLFIGNKKVTATMGRVGPLLKENEAWYTDPVGNHLAGQRQRTIVVTNIPTDASAKQIREMLGLPGVLVVRLFARRPWSAFIAFDQEDDFLQAVQYFRQNKVDLWGQTLKLEEPKCFESTNTIWLKQSHGLADPDLHSLLSRFGQIWHISHGPTHDSVWFSTVEEAALAQRSLNGRKDGLAEGQPPWTVNISQPRSKTKEILIFDTYNMNTREIQLMCVPYGEVREVIQYRVPDAFMGTTPAIVQFYSEDSAADALAGIVQKSQSTEQPIRGTYSTSGELMHFKRLRIDDIKQIAADIR